MHCLTRRWTQCATLLVLLFVLPGAVQAQWRWKDSRGQLHASDQPPPGDIADKDVLQRPAPRATVQAAAATAPTAASAVNPAAKPPASSAQVDPELQQRRARADQEAKAKAQVEEQRLAAQRADNCQRARQHLATLDTGARLVRFNAQGERVVVDDATRAQEAAQARAVAADNCR